MTRTKHRRWINGRARNVVIWIYLLMGLLGAMMIMTALMRVFLISDSWNTMMMIALLLGYIVNQWGLSHLGRRQVRR